MLNVEKIYKYVTFCEVSDAEEGRSVPVSNFTWLCMFNWLRLFMLGLCNKYMV